jgi:predicted acylesterase/phospholipase RssA
LVLTGGVTSGVIYPLAALELARAYRFKNIGGTSAGAMAAALTAAAEYQRRKGGLSGYEVLRQLPDQLGGEVDGRPRLLSLFQPQRGTRRLFKVVLAMLDRSSVATRVSAGLLGIVANYWPFAVLGLVLLALMFAMLAPLLGWPGLLGAVLASLVVGGTALTFALYRDIVHGLVGNSFGLCNGGPGEEAERPSLISWLHRGIQMAAGRRVGGPDPEPPLTFDDLWRAPGFPPAWLEGATGEAARSINLQVITANLTHGRPYRLPLDDDPAARLFFKPDELREYFPGDVVDFLVAKSVSYAPRLRFSDPPASAVPADLRELPRGDLPIVVAARLSLSFPFLFSAVPLWAIDYEAQLDKRGVKRCWFSDGGVCSNFPIHMFDAFVPRWPTFGVSLESRDKGGQRPPVSLTARHSEGRGDRRVHEDDAHARPLSRLLRFVASVVLTAKDWNDRMEARMPGVRDRIVHIELQPHEGGLNLAMKAPLIKKLARRYGACAGRELVRKFAPDAVTGELARGWQEHRWVRFNALLAGLRQRVQGITTALELTRHAVPVGAQISSAYVSRPLDGEDVDEAPLSAAQADALDRLSTALNDLERAFASAAHPQPYDPQPAPTMRIRPPL